MAITDFQRSICRVIASSRIEQGESYVAGGVALNTLINAPRVSHDIDIFHDTREALIATWDTDRALLQERGYVIEVARERPTFVEAIVRRGERSVVMQWVCDSAYRFFPLMENADFGLTLHPFDLATNKTLALVGRLEVRDWVDVIACSAHLQHLGLLAWAACGKDPGFSPAMILEEAKRSGRYTAAEVGELAFEGEAPRAAQLSVEWSRILAEAEEIIDQLPPEQAGRCVLDAGGQLFSGTAQDAASALKQGAMLFHEGCIRGAMPTILEERTS